MQTRFNNLDESSLHIWYCSNDELLKAQQEQLLEWLDSKEKERYQQFKFPQDKRRFLISHAMLRKVLSQYLGVDGSAVEYGYHEKGKPYLLHSDLQFNLSHTKGLTVCAVAMFPVGVDVEHVGRQARILNIADRYFNAELVKKLRRQNGEKEALNVFIQYWSLLEATVKCIGQGLTYPTKNILFDEDNNQVDSFNVKFLEDEEKERMKWRAVSKKRLESH